MAVQVLQHIYIWTKQVRLRPAIRPEYRYRTNAPVAKQVGAAARVFEVSTR